MSKYPGRILKATAPTVTSNEAKGIWTVDEALQYRQAGTWPEQIIPDPYFNQTTLLLHGDGTNGAQNNTFLDSSSNTFTITRNGNTTQGSFSPFSNADGEWSNYFDGSGDWLSVSASAMAFSTGDFTIQALVYLTEYPTSTYSYIYDARSANTASDHFLRVEATGILSYRMGFGTKEETTATVPLNAWTLVSVTRASGTVKVYIDAVEANSHSGSTANLSIGSAVGIGCNKFDNTQGIKGYISNFRVNIGTAETITVPTTPFTAISGTSLLTCQSNRFVDNSSNAFAITVNGTPSVQPFSPFAPSAAYSVSTNGGSGYFDGSGDYLATPIGESAFGLDGDFTINYWVYLLSTAVNERQISSGGYYTPGKNGNWYFGVNASNLNFASYDGQSTQISIFGTVTNNLNEWMYISAVRSGSTLTLYKNGVSINSGTLTRNLSDGQASGLQIGRLTTYGDTHGYIAEMEIVKGVATAPSGVPTAPATSTANTSLLLNFTNAGIFDNTGKNNLETVGNAQIDTTTKKYGTGSMEFDGTGDYLLLRPNPQLIFEGDFTIEFWCYVTLAGSTYHSPIGNYSGSTTTNWQIEIQNTGVIRLYYNGSSSPIVSSSGVITNETFQHIAAVRSGSTVALYVDGSQISTASFSGTIGNITTNTLIASIPQTSTQELDGYIDDLRITKGVARYTANFTPPTKAFTDQ